MSKNIILKTDQFNIDDVYFCEPNKNNIMNEGNFIRLLYSTELFTLNGIYLLLPINNIGSEKYFNKYKYIFDCKQHHTLIEKITNIERHILSKLQIKKTPHYKIQSQLYNGNIKIMNDLFDSNDNYLLLKISGIWETDNEFGITYKFIPVKQDKL